jgi:hypothetical protein
MFPSATTVAVMGQANAVLWFDLSDGLYVPRFDVRESLLFNQAANTLLLVDLDGSVTTFNATSGVFVSKTDPAGNSLSVISYTNNGFNFGEVQRVVTTGGNTTVESYLYTYADPTVAYPVLTSVLLRRQVNGGSWVNVLQALRCTPITAVAVRSATSMTWRPCRPTVGTVSPGTIPAPHSIAITSSPVRPVRVAVRVRRVRLGQRASRC